GSIPLRASKFLIVRKKINKRWDAEFRRGSLTEHTARCGGFRAVVVFFRRQAWPDGPFVPIMTDDVVSTPTWECLQAYLRAVEFDVVLMRPVDGRVQCWIDRAVHGFAFFVFGEFLLCAAGGLFARFFLPLHFFLAFLECNRHRC